MFRGLSRLGLRAAEVVRMAFRQVILQRPLVVRIPNAETVAALNEPTHNLRQFDSVEGLFADIETRAQAPRALDTSE